MRMKLKIVDEGGAVFTEMSARSLIGQTPALNMRETDDGPIIADLGRGRVVAAEVVDDGAALSVTVETDEDIAPLQGNFSPMSFHVEPGGGGELRTRREDWDPNLIKRD